MVIDDPQDSPGTEALACYPPARLEEFLRERWTPQVVHALRDAVKGLVKRFPGPTKEARIVPMARRVLGAGPEVLHALARDPDLAGWAHSVRQILADPASQDRLRPILALFPRFVVSVALLSGGDASLKLRVGVGGRARIPADGRVLQAPPGTLLHVHVEGGSLRTHTKPPRKAGPFELADGDGSAGARPGITSLSGGALFQPLRVLSSAVEILAGAWPALLAEAGVLAPVVGAIRTQRDDVSHAAGLKGVRGQLWMSFQPEPLAVAETLGREVSHLRFRLIEDRYELVSGVDVARLKVPWRQDLRPLRALLMEIHAWVRVVGFLERVRFARFKTHADERRLVLNGALEQAFAAIEGVTELTEAGRDVLEACRKSRRA